MKKVRLNVVWALGLSFLLLCFLLLSGCAATDRLAGSSLFGKSQEEEMAGAGAGLQEGAAPANYYWPWVDHALVELSSGEVIEGPDIFESDYEFITEYAAGESYLGRLVFRVEESDVFSLQWINLQLDVDYYEGGQWVLSRSLTFLLDDFVTEVADDGVEEYVMSKQEQAEGFVVSIKKLQLGKEAEGSFSTEPLNYVAFEVEMKALKSP